MTRYQSKLYKYPPFPFKVPSTDEFCNTCTVNLQSEKNGDAAIIFVKIEL